MCCHIEMFKLYLQAFIIPWMSGIITLQERGSTISDTHPSYSTTLLPSTTGDPGITRKTGKSKTTFDWKYRSKNVFNNQVDSLTL